ncbi:MAG: sensor domain-containing diguanylate cyclase [Oligoflexales bacterium]|nr:sensor domain-containing diguanylate cyclase [Oligoflexales bacterium]
MNQHLSSESKNNSLMRVFDNQRKLCAALLDPFVLLDSEQNILEASGEFAEIFKTEKKSLVGRNLMDLFEFSVGNKILSADELLKSVPCRFDEVKCSVKSPTKTEDGLLVIIASHPFLDRMDEVLGYFLQIRDVTADAQLQSEYKIKSQQTMTDPLTGLRNRHYLEDFVATQFEFFKEKTKLENEKGAFLTLMMVDIDHFKKINDTYGHQAGDFIIKGVARQVSELVRKTDVVCRYGGEEFIVFLINTSAHYGKKVADKMRQSIQDKSFHFENKILNVTASFGISQLNATDQQIAQVIARADAALYKAKHSGRNQVQVIENEEELKNIQHIKAAS